MAPEVLQGAEADARSEIFSFGCVLCDTITAKCNGPKTSQFLSGYDCCREIAV